MKGNLVDMIPDKMQIEVEDIGHLFYRYIQQSPTKTPQEAAREWLEVMSCVCEEDWGQSLKGLGVTVP